MITSLSNPQMKHIIQLQKKSRYRNENQQFVAEGIKMVLETPDRLLVKVYVSESFRPDLAAAAWLGARPHEIVCDKVFRELSQTQTPQGILAVVRMVHRDFDELLKGSSFVVLDMLQDPGNLGTILRTAEGAGVDAVIMNSTCVDIYNPKVVRSTMGALYRVKFIYVDDLTAALMRMKDAGTRLYAAHLKGEKDYYAADFTGKCGFLIGNEANGLSYGTAAMATEYIKIPMSGQVESLNAAMAAGILMYEARRQKAVAGLLPEAKRL